MSMSSLGPSMRHATPRGRVARKPSSLGGRGSVGGPASSAGGLSEVGGGGSVEDGTAWSMVARFVCSVPGCGASFTLKQNLQRHQTQKHGRRCTAKPTSAAGDDISDDVDDDDYSSGTMPAFY